MPKNSKLVHTLKELIKREVQKEVKKIFITEGLIRPTETSKPKDEVSYVKDPILNKVLNETAQKDGMEEYPTMGGGTFDSTKMAQAMGYGGKFGNPEMKRQAIGISTAQAVGVDPDSVPEDVMKALTKDYSGVVKAMDKRDNK